MKSFNLRLKKSLNEIFLVEPNDLGFWPLTTIFKKTTRPLKTMPFIIIIPIALLVAVLMYFVFGYLLVRLVNVLQYGF